ARDRRAARQAPADHRAVGDRGARDPRGRRTARHPRRDGQIASVLRAEDARRETPVARVGGLAMNARRDRRVEGLDELIASALDELKTTRPAPDFVPRLRAHVEQTPRSVVDVRSTLVGVGAFAALALAIAW